MTCKLLLLISTVNILLNDYVLEQEKKRKSSETEYKPKAKSGF